MSVVYLEMLSNKRPYVGTWEFSVTEPWETVSCLLESSVSHGKPGPALALKFLVLVFQSDLQNYLEDSLDQNRLSSEYKPLLASVLCPSDSTSWSRRMQHLCQFYTRAVKDNLPVLETVRALVGLTAQVLQLKERSGDSNTHKLEMARFLAFQFQQLGLGERSLWAQLYLLEPAWLPALVSREMISLATNVKLNKLSLRTLVQNFVNVVPSDSAEENSPPRLMVKINTNNNDADLPQAKSSKSKSSQKAKENEFTRKSSRVKSSNKSREVVEKPGPLPKKTPSFSSVPASPRKSMRRSKRSIVKMVTMSQTFSALEDSPSPTKSSKAKTKSPRKKSTKKKKDEGLTKINTLLKPVSIDDLLRLPETVGDTGLTMDQILDKVDLEIKDQQKKHEEEMKMLDQTIEKQREQRRALDKRMEENAVLKEKLAAGLTKPVLVEMFEKNVPYLTDIREGRVVSARHNSFHKSPMTRQALLYTIITHPFTDEQLDWTYEEFKARWMKTNKQFHGFNEYMWKVGLSYCFLL